jgi:filamentous hemagglutinin family protein
MVVMLQKQYRNWAFKLASWGMSGAIIVFAENAYAQRRPIADNTLGNNNSVVEPDVFDGVPGDRIQGGIQRGANLFHSFQEFNIDAERAAYFDNPAGVETILSRVTGDTQSDILGRLGVLGDANLFLLNPNGIIFGPGASLDIRGSFVASTANSFVFSEGAEFSATNPQTPPLLAINLPIGLQYGANQPGAINVNQSTFRVRERQSLILLGGEIVLDDSSLFSGVFNGGRIELGSGTSRAGIVELQNGVNGLSLSFPSSFRRADIVLANNSSIDVDAILTGGDIAMTARNVEILAGSRLEAGVTGLFGRESGNIAINATGIVTLAGRSNFFNRGSSIVNNVSRMGNGGDINITAASLILRDGADLSATINTTLNTDSGGDININTNILSIRDGAQIRAIASGQGDSGNVTITASNLVEVIGGPNRFPSSLDTVVDPGATGNGGDVRIETRRLVVQNAGQIGPSTFGAGDAGNLILTASDAVEVIGRSPAGLIQEPDPTSDGSVPSLLSTQVERDGGGDGGNITIQTRRLSIRDGAAVSARSFGIGTDEQADAGNITVIASDLIEITGAYEYELAIGPQIRRSGLFTQVGRRVDGDPIRGDAGNIRLETDRLVIQDRATLNSRNSGPGSGGNIDITAESVELVRGGSSISAQNVGIGNAGNLTVNAEQVMVWDGIISATTASGRGGNIALSDLSSLQVNNGTISASTTSGRAGSLTVNAPNGSIQLRGTLNTGESGGLTVEGGRSGRAGSLSITADQLTLDAGSAASVSSGGQAGSLTVSANSIRLDQASLTAEARAGSGANIRLQELNLLLMRNGSEISAQAFNEANGGNITMDVSDGFIVAVPSENSDIIASADRGDGGNIEITTQGIFGLEFRDQATPLSDITASSEFGVDGEVSINTPDVDPSRGLAELPDDVIDASNQIAQACVPTGQVATQRSEFLITGRGGLPPSPGEVIGSDAAQVDLVTSHSEPENQVANVPIEEPIEAHRENRNTLLVEAQGWVMGRDGEIILTATPPAVTPQNSWQNLGDCQAVE